MSESSTGKRRKSSDTIDSRIVGDEYGDIGAVIRSLYQPPLPRQPGEFTAKEAAQEWDCKTDSAAARLKSLVDSGVLSAREGISDSRKRTLFYKVIKRE